MTTTADENAEDPISRAKAIAAKLSGEKRKSLWDSNPNENTNYAAIATNGDDDPKKAKLKLSSGHQATKEPDTKRVWINSVTEDRPATHFVSFLKPRLHQIVEDITKQLPNEAPEEPPLVITLEGKGSSETPPPPGVPVPALHCLISGSKNAVFAAVPKVEDVLVEAEQAPVSKSDIVLASTMQASRDAVTKHYQPVSVAQLIHSQNQVALGEDHKEESFGVPNALVGFIIGRGGENITKLQARTGARIQIQQERDLKPGQTQRIITLQANTQEAIDACRAMIDTLVAERSAGMSNVAVPKRDSKVQQAILQGHVHVEVLCDDKDAGLVIGKQGSTIRQVQEQSGASVTVPSQAAEDGKRHISITHPNEEGAKYAQQLIENILQSKVPRGQQVTRQVQIPDKDVGLCIGRGGSIIKHMQDVSHCRIQIPPSANVGEAFRVATVTGPPEGVQSVEQMIRQICHDQSSQGIFSNANSQYQQYGTASSTSTNGNYSAEWAAYHAAQAAAASGVTAVGTSAPVASGIAAASTTNLATGQAAVAAPSPSVDAYYEQFFRYAYYYGEPAARAYYGAWSPPVGTPNPYGVNPNGPAPVANGAQPVDTSVVSYSHGPASSVSQQPQVPHSGPTYTNTDPSNPRDSSQRRGVSNLPAWMTKG